MVQNDDDDPVRLDISPVITHRLPYLEFEKDFQLMRSGQSGKIILHWSDYEWRSVVVVLRHLRYHYHVPLPRITATCTIILLPLCSVHSRNISRNSSTRSGTRDLYKTERPISTPQRAHIRTADGKEVLNLCANNYLGLADHPEVIEAAKAALDRWGFGLASVRFICGTQEIHNELEAALTRFHQTEDTILYGSCFDANGGLFETILSNEDAVISDELNHASIIDGIRLCKAQRYRYRHNDMNDLEAKLKEARGFSLSVDRDGRCIFNGWHHCKPERDL